MPVLIEPASHAQCAREGDKFFPPYERGAQNMYEGKCLGCWRSQVVSAMPSTVRNLLLRILRPSKDKDGNHVIVTASEALDTLNVVLEAGIPRMQVVYENWAQCQERLVRMDHPRDVKLSTIIASDSHHRWLMLEHLRGRFLHSDLVRRELNCTKWETRRHLSPRQIELRDKFREACGATVSDASPEDEEAVKKALAGEENNGGDVKEGEAEPEAQEKGEEQPKSAAAPNEREDAAKEARKGGAEEEEDQEIVEAKGADEASGSSADKGKGKRMAKGSGSSGSPAKKVKNKKK